MRRRLIFTCLVGSALLVALGVCYLLLCRQCTHKLSAGQIVEVFLLPNEQLLVVNHVLDNDGSFVRSEVQTWTISTHVKTTILTSPMLVRSADVSPDRRLLALGNSTGTIQVYEIEGPKAIWTLTAKEDLPITAIRFSAQRNEIESFAYLSTSANGRHTFRSYWDLDSGKFLRSEQVDEAFVYPPSECGDMLAQVTRGNVIEVRSRVGNLIIREIETNWRRVNTLVFSHGCEYLAAATGDLEGGGPAPRFAMVHSEVAVWQLSTGKKVYQHNCHRAGVVSLSFSLDDHYLASGDAVGEVAVYDLIDGKTR